MRVVVVGAGVIGLTCAHRLVRAGHTVEVWSRDAVQDTTSAVAAALWYPFRALPEDAVTRWAGATYDMLAILSVRPETGVALLRGRELFRTPRPDPWWAAAVPRLRRVTDLPPGYADGYELAAPVVRMPTYLPWLLDELAAAGVRLRARTLTDLGPARDAADVVVNATGLGARALAGDRELTGVRGQVVRVADPGLTGWTHGRGPPGRHGVRGAPRHRRRLRRHRGRRRREPRARPGRGGADPGPLPRGRAGAGGRAGARACGRRPAGPHGGPAGARGRRRALLRARRRRRHAVLGLRRRGRPGWWG